ncbi:transglutaminase-like domain-containing protein [Hydrogenoanaerobacterium sp.]|uniref:transglutaminase-like domain-containing protein n=1 Tax=Hydrogenoanaerobacterium sp. TaxID=2953763 RepID=UPI00289C1D94|nr:transglutaminase-like domain-containing protein [Hydrogenoanaerobacterium sp.]
MKRYRNYHRALAVFIVGCLFFMLIGCGDSAAVGVPSVSSEISSSVSSGEESSSGSAHSTAESSESKPADSISEPESVRAPSATTIEPSDPPASSEPSAPTGVRDSTAQVLVPSADGTSVLGNSLAEIDASNTAEGYVMVRYLGSNSNVKLQLTRDGGTTYTYNLNASGSYETFPLTAGSGGYTLNVFENVSGNQYALACGEYLQVTLRSGLLPYLYPNQYVNFWSGCNTVTLGSELASTANSDLEVVEKVYNYVVNNISYDFDKAATATSGYLPNVDTIISTGKGICFDYAAVMVTMLRTQRIPTKLVVGYSGSVYHAWISVYITDVGWINDIIYFDGTSWVRMDPTFASSAKSSPDIMNYIGNGGNYNAMFVY